MLLIITMLLPLAGGALLPLFKFRSMKKRGIYTEAVVILTSILTWISLINTDNGAVRVLTVLNGFDVVFRVDDMSRIFAGLVSILWPFAVLYALEYMENEERPTQFFTFYTMTYGVTLGMAFSASVFTMYIFFEFMTIVTLPLVVHKHDGESSRAGRRYVYFSISGAAMALITVVFLMYYSENDLFTPGGTLSVTKCAGMEETLEWLFLLAFVGFGTKVAVFPMSAWLPSASVAPTPVTALLHAVAVVNGGAFGVIRVIYYSFGADFLRGSVPHYIALGLACFTVVYGSVMAVKERHLKRRLAYSTVSNLSYMLMGAALMTRAGMTGSLLHFIAHSFMKITLFYCAGAIMVKTGCTYIQELRGLHRSMPFTCAVFTVAAAAMAGLPPMSGFVSKWNLLSAAADLGGSMGIIAVCAIIISAILTAVYLISVAFTMYFRPQADEIGFYEPSWKMRLPMGVLCAAAVLLGIFFEPIISFIKLM